MRLKQSNIDYELSIIKDWYIANWPLCGFCNHRVKEGYGELAHLIRRSASRELQTLKLNTVLSHHDCHSIFDDKPAEAIYLPRFYEIMYIIFLIDDQYYNQMVGTLYSDVWFPDFFMIEKFMPTIEFHGELLTLQPLTKTPATRTGVKLT